MFPLILLALGAGAFALYELSPKTHTWVDDHTKAIADALKAHNVADAHMNEASLKTAWEQLEAARTAFVANQVAALRTADAAKTATTPAQRKDVANSANAVVDRQAKLDALMKQLGQGECGVHTYPKVSARVKDALLARLKTEGMTITGANPWEIDTHNHGVRLRAMWDASTETLFLIVTSGQNFLVTCDLIWGKIDPIIKSMAG